MTGLPRDGSLRFDDGNESSELSTPPAISPAPEPANDDPEYGSFMDYYVTGDADEPKTKAAPKSKASTKTSKQAAARPPPPQTQAPGLISRPVPHQGPAPPPQNLMGPPRDQGFRPQPGPPPAHYPPPPPAQRQPLPPPLPQVQLIDFDAVNKDDSPMPRCTVGEMVTKLRNLSTALTNFGGVPPVPKSPGQQSRCHSAPPMERRKADKETDVATQPPTQQQSQPEPESQKQKPKKSEKKEVVETFLGLFDEGDESDSSENATKSDDDTQNKDQKPSTDAEDDMEKLDYQLPEPGEPDGPLTYGIQFIQNALKSWAQQRLQHQYHSELVKQAHDWQQQCIASQKRGPGRPRKFPDDHDHERQLPPTQPPPFQIKMESTPEGVAIKAFQHVLDSGCLQVNSMLPTELTTALRHLYMQIDHLINQGAKNEPQWQCMSYGAQIAANRTRVEKWRDAQARAQEEMARQQQLANQAMMRQMGLAQTTAAQHPPLTPEQARAEAQAREIELDRRRSMNLALQQPEVSANMLNPMQFNNQPRITPAASHASTPKPPPARRSQPGSPAVPNPQSTVPSQHGMPNLTPRSGASMKFSFPPPSAEAAKAFGANAFPNGLPTHANGTAPPSVQQTPQPVNGGPVEAASVRPSIETSAQQANGRAHQANGQIQKDAAHKASSKPPPQEVVTIESDDGDVIHVKKENQTPAPMPTAPATGGFTAVNTLPQKRKSSGESRPTSATGTAAAAKKKAKRGGDGGGTKKAVTSASEDRLEQFRAMQAGPIVVDE